MALSVDPEQTAAIGAVCSGSILLACILKFASNIRQLFAAAISADDIFRCIFLGTLGVNIIYQTRKAELAERKPI